MNYTLNQLQVFLKIAQLESVTRAAEELHLTQPAVSIQLKNFQDQFEVPLTEVIGRKLYVTDFGREIAAAAEQILDQVNAINFKTMAFRGQLTGRLKISVVSTGKYIMPYFLAAFLKEHPGIELIMDVTNKEKVIKSLEENEVDFSLVSIIPEQLNTMKIDLMPNKLYLMANREYIRPDDGNFHTILEELPLIYREKGSGTRQVMERFMAQHKLSTIKRIELTSNEAVKQAVIAGLGCSIMPLIGIKNELLKGDLKIIPIPNLPMKTLWSLIWPKGKNHSPVAESFKQYIEANKASIIQSTFGWYEAY